MFYNKKQKHCSNNILLPIEFEKQYEERLRSVYITGGDSNPHGMSKLVIENMLDDIYKSDNEWHIVNLC